LKEAVGYPWTTMPDFMFSHLSSGYGGQGTLCGALGVATQFFRMAAFDDAATHVTMIDELFQWYSRADFPTRRFDHICYFPNQIVRNAKSPLCHISVSQWTLAAGAGVTSKQKKDRCAKVTGEVIYHTVTMLNQYAEGQYTARHYPFEEENKTCLICHGVGDMWHDKDGMNNQQGKMACIHCHQALFE
jgi:hypothetical protein